LCEFCPHHEQCWAWIEDARCYQRGLVRELGRILSAIPFYLGYLWMLWDPEKQTWHDKLVRSVVVPVAAYSLPR
jgi:uncharacterized RDD family membrane protein YckC